MSAAAGIVWLVLFTATGIVLSLVALVLLKLATLKWDVVGWRK